MLSEKTSNHTGDHGEQNTLRPAIEVKNLSKCYHVYRQPIDRLKQFILPRIKKLFRLTPRQYFNEFWALSDISFTVMPGETVGIIGKNGSGKSTLLQIISGILNPTHGTVEISGRVAALLELGSGFNPELTGKENIYLNASILGLSESEINEKYLSIIDFADIGDFINQPIKTYSSGMVVRLAFAVQAQIDPQILIVDEALAVGDAKFQAKCFERLRQLKDKGTSILLVTHSSEQIINHCDKAILLDSGKQIEQGEPKHIINRYLDILFGKSSSVTAPSEVVSLEKNANTKPSLSQAQDIFSSHPNYNEHEYRWGDHRAKIIDYRLATKSKIHPQTITSGDEITLTFSVHFFEDLFRPIFGITLKTKEGIFVCGTNSELLAIEEIREHGHKGTSATISATFKCNLAQGDYFISLGVATRNGEEIIPHDRRYDSIHIHVAPTSSFYGLADLNMQLHNGEV